MPVEFLTDEEAAAYGAYQGAPSQAEIEKLFFLDAANKRLVARRRALRRLPGPVMGVLKPPHGQEPLPRASLTGRRAPKLRPIRQAIPVMSWALLDVAG